MIGPTVFHEILMNAATATREQLTAIQAVCSSNLRVKREPCLAQGKRHVTTPCSLQLTLQEGPTRITLCPAQSQALQVLAPSLPLS